MIPPGVKICYNLTVNLFEKGNSPCKQEFPEVRIKLQILDHYPKDICNITTYYGIFTTIIAITKIKSHKTPNTNKRYTYRLLKSFYRLNEIYTTPKFTKSNFNIHKRCIFNHL